jgi:hypothetical protein
MKPRNVIALASMGMALGLPSTLPAADDGTLAKDLTATITLLGLPCGQVVNVQRLGDNDYLAVCKDRNRYRVFVNAQGRVVAQKQ